jgi:hypothetical protein
MRTTIVFKATETEPEKSLLFAAAAPTFDLEGDVVNLMDYDCMVISDDYPLKSIKSITWDEEE